MFFVCHPLQVMFILCKNIGSNSKIAVDESDNGEFRVERVDIII